MKKHDEGYALVLVLVVMVVVCLVAVTIMSISVSNLQDQQTSIDRMNDRYEAAGLIEEAVALIGAQLQTTQNGFGNTYLIDILDENKILYTEPKWLNEEKGAVTFQLTAISGSCEIVCDILVMGTEIEEEMTNTFNITNPVLSYASYEINILDQSEGGATQ